MSWVEGAPTRGKRWSATSGRGVGGGSRSAALKASSTEGAGQPRGEVRRQEDVEGNSIAAAIVARVKGARDALELTGDILPFGSHVNGLRTSTSDCDLSYVPKEGPTEKPILVLQRFASELPKHGFTGIITVFQASVPLVKAVDPSGVEVDLCVGNSLGIRNSKLVAAYCGIDQRVGEVGRLVKQWAKSLELVGSSDGHLNSYAYTLLTLFYLMKRQPPVIPNLQDLAVQDRDSDPVIIKDRRWGREIPWDCRFWDDIHLIPKSSNSENVDALLKGFFVFYSTGGFDWGKHAVSVRLANTQPGPTKGIGLYSSVQPEQWYIEDPFDLRHNLASQCSREGRQRIMDNMKECLNCMSEAKDVRSGFEAHCKTGPSSCMLKCRVHLEKLTKDQFLKTFDTVGVGPFQVNWPLAPNRGPDEVREAVARGDEVVREAFLEFNSENNRRRVHKLNETYVGEWQLRFLPCSFWALHDARRQESFAEAKVGPTQQAEAEESEKSIEDASEEVRRGLRVAQTKLEIDVLILRAQALGLSWEEHMGKSKLDKLPAGGNSEVPQGSEAQPLPPASEEAESETATRFQ